MSKVKVALRHHFDQIATRQFISRVPPQDQRGVKLRIGPMLGFTLCKRVAVMIADIELLHRIHKGQFCLVRMHPHGDTACTIKRFRQVAEWANAQQAADIVLLKITPQVISVLDYEKGFSHTELAMV